MHIFIGSLVLIFFLSTDQQQDLYFVLLLHRKKCVFRILHAHSVICVFYEAGCKEINIYWPTAARNSRELALSSLAENNKIKYMKMYYDAFSAFLFKVLENNGVIRFII